MGNDVSVRTLDQPIYDGTTGSKIADAVEYQLGVTVNGVFVPFVSRTGDYVDAVVARGQDDASRGTQTDVQPDQPAPAQTPAPDQPAPDQPAPGDTGTTG